jgi:putative ABC transport system permease protein
MTGRWRERWERLRHTLRRPADSRDIDDEVASHVALAADELMARGIDPQEAQRLAAARFGSRLAARELAADARGVPGLEAVLTDLRYAARGLRSAPGFTVAAVATLALGIGANVAVFTVSQATLFKGYRAVPDNDRLVYLTTGRDCCVSYQDVADWQAATTIDGLGAVADLRVAIQADASAIAETSTATQIMPGTFRLLRVSPVLGRDFTAADAVPGAPAVAILADDYWRARFAADPAVLGRVLRINGVATTVVGVMPPAFAFPQYQQLWLPLGAASAPGGRDARAFWFAVGRLADGATIDGARVELATIGDQLAEAYPDTNARVRPVVQTFRELFFGSSAVAIYGALWAAVGLVLLVACANLANLLLARAAGRTREIAVRMALGAGRARLVRQLLFESTMLSAAGGALGWWIASRAVRLYETVSVPPTQPWARQMLDYAIDGRAVAYLATLTAITALLFGLWPALRLASLDFQAALRDGGRGAAGTRAGRRATSVFVVTQVALAVVLLSAAGVLVRSFLAAHNRDLGFEPTRTVVALTMMLPADRYPGDAARHAFYDQLIARIEALPGVESVGFSDGLIGQSTRRLPVELDGQSTVDDVDLPRARVASVGGEYFAALGVTVRSGRTLAPADDRAKPPVALINRRLAEMLWPGADAVGRRLRVGEQGREGPWRTVVGIVPDLIQGDPARADVDPSVYLPMRERPTRGAWLLVRTLLPPGPLVEPLRRELQAADPSMPIWLGPFTMSEWIGGNNWRRGVYGGLLTLFAVLALLLAGSGLFAVVAAAVAQRTQEIGVRLAIGATPRAVLSMVLRQGMTPALAGLAIGLALSTAANRALRAQLVQVEPWDPATLATVAAILLTAAAVGCLVPALRATRVDPLVALRHD